MTQSVFNIPLTPSQNQKMTITLNGVVYKLFFKWVDAVEGGWIFDISDANDNPIDQGIPLVTGADLMAQLAYLGLGGSLIVYSNGVPTDVPTFDNLGVDSNLYFVTPSVA